MKKDEKEEDYMTNLYRSLKNKHSKEMKDK